MPGGRGYLGIQMTGVCNAASTISIPMLSICHRRAEWPVEAAWKARHLWTMGMMRLGMEEEAPCY